MSSQHFSFLSRCKTCVSNYSSLLYFYKILTFSSSGIFTFLIKFISRNACWNCKCFHWTLSGHQLDTQWPLIFVRLFCTRALEAFCDQAAKHRPKFISRRWQSSNLARAASFFTVLKHRCLYSPPIKALLPRKSFLD